MGAEEFEAPEEQVLTAEGVELPNHAAHRAVADGCGVSAQPTHVHAWGLRGLVGRVSLGNCGCQAAVDMASS